MQRRKPRSHDHVTGACLAAHSYMLAPAEPHFLSQRYGREFQCISSGTLRDLSSEPLPPVI